MGNENNFDGSIKELNKWRKSLDYDNGDYCYGDDITKHSLDVAIETMRKYKKIEQIYQKWNEVNDFTYNQAMSQIGKVLKDGND